MFVNPGTRHLSPFQCHSWHLSRALNHQCQQGVSTELRACLLTGLHFLDDAALPPHPQSWLPRLPSRRETSLDTSGGKQRTSWSVDLCHGEGHPGNLGARHAHLALREGIAQCLQRRARLAHHQQATRCGVQPVRLFRPSQRDAQQSGHCDMPIFTAVLAMTSNLSHGNPMSSARPQLRSCRAIGAIR